MTPRWCWLGVALATLGCAGRQAGTDTSPLGAWRRDAAASRDAATLGRWLLAELTHAGGDARQAQRARARLDEVGGGDYVAYVARGLDDSLHGRVATAPDHYLRAAQLARDSDAAEAPLYAWFAVERAVEGRSSASGLWARWQPFVESALAEPRHLGWRARGELGEWWAKEAKSSAIAGVEERIARQFGCVAEVRLAGPFGSGFEIDQARRWPAEAPGPWPRRFPRSPKRSQPPRVLETSRQGCFVSAKEPQDEGIFYAETYLELDRPRALLLAAQAALTLSVDDQPLLDREPRRWGEWPRFGVAVRLSAGRHRVLARLAGPSTALRVLDLDGQPAKLESSADPAPGYVTQPPERLADPNLLTRYVHDGAVTAPEDDGLRFIAAWMLWSEGQADAASVLLEPLVREPREASGPTLALSAQVVQDDPLFDDARARDLMRELHRRAAEKDPGLWQSELALALMAGDKAGASESVPLVKALAQRFKETPGVGLTLARLYGELGWTAERSQLIKQLVQRFPESLEALAAGSATYEAEGDFPRADALLERLRLLDPDSELVLDRAIERADWDGAVAELERLGQRRPERKELTERLRGVLRAAGRRPETAAELERLLHEAPRSASARLALADWRFAQGERGALRAALLDALARGAPTAELQACLDLVEGSNDLEPYRLDGRAVIREYEKSGQHLPGTAARLLDYSAVWVRSDGSSRHLSHELVRIQSAEGIASFAEQPRPQGLVYHLRVIKADGRVLEPELVAGKPTVTLPHLEIGDTIETEHVISTAGDGQGGLVYPGLQWFFREESVAYARSELVLLTPADKPLEIETRGEVPAPSVSELHGMQLRRWRMDRSPAAPSEPNSPPASEVLPSVRVGWVLPFEQRLALLSDAAQSVTPVDPRVRRIAERIVEKLPPAARRARARALYTWVLDNIEEGEEQDGRKAIVGKSGSRWRALLSLAEALGLELTSAIAENRLLPAPLGPLSDTAQLTGPLLVVQTEQGPTWLTLGGRFTPFGYVPAELRGSPAYLLVPGGVQRAQVPAGGSLDGVSYDAQITLAADGQAQVVLRQRFEGKYAASLRKALSELPASQLHDVLEARVLSRALRGARLLEHEVLQLDALDEPLTLKLTAAVPGFALRDGDGLLITPPFAFRVSSLAALPERQTPLLLSEATLHQVSARIRLPAGARVSAALTPKDIRWGELRVSIRDRVEGGVLVLERSVELPAGRIQPSDYARFQTFARDADDALAAAVRVTLGGG